MFSRFCADRGRGGVIHREPFQPEARKPVSGDEIVLIGYAADTSMISSFDLGWGALLAKESLHQVHALCCQYAEGHINVMIEPRMVQHLLK